MPLVLLSLEYRRAVDIFSLKITKITTNHLLWYQLNEYLVIMIIIHT